MADPGDGIRVINDSGKTIYANERMDAILGVPRGAMNGVESFEFVYPEDQESARHMFGRKSQGDSNTFTFRLRKHDGSPIWAKIQGTPMHDSKGRFSGIIGTFTVIDSR